MRKLSFYPKLAARSMKSNRRFYVPYILTVIGTAAAFYIMAAIVSAFDRQLDALYQGEVMDINAEIKVLQSLLTGDGLADDQMGGH